MSETDGTGQGLFEFLAWAGERGEMVEATAKSRLAASRAVLSTHDDPGAVDLRTLDIANTLDRFETLNRMKYSSGSMQTYKQRFEAAVATYLAWLDKDPNWKTAGKPARADGNGEKASRPRKILKRPASSTGHSGQGEPAPEHVSSTATATATQMIPYDLPLRPPNMLVRLTLPVDLTSADAERIAAFVRSLAFDKLPAAQRDEHDHPRGG